MNTTYDYDIAVIGGGMSGVAAAVSAARRGARVVLIEKTSFLGGVGTGGMITMVMTSPVNFYGLGRELIYGLIESGGAHKIEKPAVGGYDYYPFDNESMKSALDTLVTESGATLLLEARLCGAECEDGHITALHLHGREGAFSLSAKVFIDTSGDAVLAEAAGEEIVYGDGDGNIQAPTMMAYYAGVDFERYEKFLESFDDGVRPAKINMIHSLVPRAVEDGVLSEVDLHHPGIFRIKDDIGLMNAGHVYGADIRTSKGLTEATLRGRKMAREYFEFYKRYVPGFENAYMTSTGSSLALREGKHAVGRYTMPFSDKADYVKHPDAIMRMDGGAVSDLHASNPSREAYEAYKKLFADRERVRRDDFATLPLRSLQAARNKNLLLAGRCASASREVLGQIRIMGYCLMMGEAAGIAAAIAVKKNIDTAGVAAAEVQAELLVCGVPTA